ncbi:MAG TPA: DUF1127 domain-containing protein [Dongiaceae bacterium]|jgi:uncharacterized protein YjiS (DUF1127 family)|nr:DUF1127 domain-containing protein [Dongiaceae bacterium]
MNLGFQELGRQRLGRVAEAVSRLARQASLGLTACCIRASDAVQLWRERGRQRRALQNLNDDMLKDIGVSRCDVYRESSKSFWRE